MSSLARVLIMSAVIVVFAVKVAPYLAATYSTKETATVAQSTDQTSRVRPSGGRRVALAADDRGHFLADATVDGHTIKVVVDTGATTVALTYDTARRLGIKVAKSDFTAPISTANGVVGAAPVVLSEIRLGGISITDVRAVVVPAGALDVNLLGMSFLGRLRKVEMAAGQLVLSD